MRAPCWLACNDACLPSLEPGAWFANQCHHHLASIPKAAGIINLAKVQILDLKTGGVLVKDKMFQKRYACAPWMRSLESELVSVGLEPCTQTPENPSLRSLMPFAHVGSISVISTAGARAVMGWIPVALLPPTFVGGLPGIRR